MPEKTMWVTLNRSRRTCVVIAALVMETPLSVMSTSCPASVPRYTVRPLTITSFSISASALKVSSSAQNAEIRAIRGAAGGAQAADRTVTSPNKDATRTMRDIFVLLFDQKKNDARHRGANVAKHARDIGRQSAPF